MSIFLETARLILKTPELSDYDHLLALRSDPDVMKYIGDGSTHTATQVRDFLQGAIEYQKKHGIGFCCVFEKESREFIGQAGLFHLGYCDEQPEIEIAYRLHKKFWGKGYATELVKALIRWGFDNLPVNKLIAATHPENTASQNVLKKSGLDFREKRLWHNGSEVFWYEIYKNDAVELVAYDAQWPIMAKLEITKLYEILPNEHIIDIQHVGSTAIPGMLAKPVVDIQIAVDSLMAVKQIAIARLSTEGYVYWDENPDSTRLFFVKGMPPFGEKRTHHVHIVELESKHWREKNLFRDYLISHAETADAYRQLKIKLAQQHIYDREQYTHAKQKFINDVLNKASVELKTAMVEVVVYNPEWPELFNEEAAHIQHVLGDNCIAIHHIGSTAVPGLSAKPIIDILPVVKNILRVTDVTSAMQQLGYDAKGEYGIPFRRYFQKNNNIGRTYNVHIFEENNPEIDRHLQFRDWMRTHANDCDNYGALKRQLAAQFPYDIMGYCLGKDAFIAAINAKTGCDGPRTDIDVGKIL